MHDATINELTAAIASGDTEAFGRFYETRFDFMYALARRAARRDEAMCLDIVQDAMMKVIRSMKPFDDEAHLRGWLKAVVTNCAYDRLRAEARRRERERIATGPPPVVEPEDDLAERLAWLRVELARMDRSSVQLLTMRHRFGWTLSQIGAAVGLSPGAVDGRIGRALAELRRRGRQAFGERGES